MYIAMNKFKVVDGQGAAFEQMWQERDTYLDGVPGFQSFQLLKGVDGIYISHSTWETIQAFKAWTESEAFRKAHAQGGSKGMLQGHPEFSGYEVVL